MKWIPFLCGLLIIILTVSALPVPVDAATTGPSDPAEVEAFFDQVMPANLAQYNVPGATVAVVRDGRVVLVKGYGYSDLGNRTAVNGTTTKFRVGSITKLFTWTAVMQLADEGKIDLDADVNTYLKDFKIPDTYPGQPVTLRHLLTHTAGFEEQTRHLAAVDDPDIVSFHDYCANNIPARIYPPGAVTSYSNYGATLAGVIVENVSGMPYDQYIGSRILSPLAMNDTVLCADLAKDTPSQHTNAYTNDGGANVRSDDLIIITGPAGGLSSTAPDMAKFMLAHLENGTYRNITILSGKTASQMHAQAFTNDPRAAGMCLGFYEEFVNNKRLVVHDGDTSLFHAALVLLPDQQAGYFVSYNSVGGSHARAALMTAFMDHYYPAESAKTFQNISAGTPGLQKYAGSYITTRRNMDRFEKYLTTELPIDVSAPSDATLQVTSDSIAKVFVQASPDIFTPADGSPMASGNLIFHIAPDGTADRFSYANDPTVLYERVPWYATPQFQDSLKTAAGCLLATVLLWPLLFLFRRAYAIPEPQGPLSAGVSRGIAGMGAIVLLAFVFFLLPQVAGDPALIMTYLFGQSIPATLALVLTLPVIAAILTVGATILAIPVWKEKYWTLPHRVHYTVVVVALIAMLWWVNVWNLWVWCL
ncbi:serine hydrolase [Methanoregula sp.]|uniref:serine hydrolase domain-containing protein n=1 Tax=Methanoregula sp. TaxID=2052170 RepID=UPI00237350B7|nr:serine hydrolase [Methanoregula sp.]MDD1687009.1 serine hydrolase [Methanoregula sp.]